MDACDFAQQCPRLCALDSSPSTLMTLLSCTVTHTPHSHLPHARQQERMRLTSPADSSTPSAKAADGAAAKLRVLAAPVTAAAFRKLRRVSESLAMGPPLSFVRCFPTKHRRPSAASAAFASGGVKSRLRCRAATDVLLPNGCKWYGPRGPRNHKSRPI